jgi:hypothetical protein
MAGRAETGDRSQSVIRLDAAPHLLEPQDLDILHRTNGYCQTVGMHIGFPKAVAQIAAGGVIIQKKGKPPRRPDLVLSCLLSVIPLFSGQLSR